jgi:predicted amidohydrolase YtcJ
VVLSGDPLTTPPDDLLGLVVEQTYLAGELAYERP